jgi:hypothetical protein
MVSVAGKPVKLVHMIRQVIPFNLHDVVTTSQELFLANDSQSLSNHGV